MGQLGDAMDGESFRRIRQQCQRFRFGAQAYIFHAGEAGDTMHIIESGRVAVLATSGIGEPVTLMVLGPGDTFGELALLGASHRRSATIQAITRTETLVLSRTDFENARRTYPEFNQFLIDLLAAQVARLTDRINENALTASERIYRRLIDAARAFGVLGTGEPVAVSQSQLASMAGAKLRFTNQVLADAKKAGIVEIARRRLVVRDWAEVYRRARVRMA